MSTAIIKPQWSFVTIALMVLGFIVFWPLGLAMLAYIIWGERFGGSSEKAEAWMKKQKGQWHSGRHNRGRRHRRNAHYSTGNAAFDDYREEQLKRLDEERQRLDDEIQAFGEHMDNLAKARDREEFDRFMRDRHNNEGSHTDRDESSPWRGDKEKDEGENRQGY